MKIVLLSGASSIHTTRWANGLARMNFDVHLISQHKLTDNLCVDINYYEFPYRGVMGYFAMVHAVRKLIKKINPDIVNAHYASGYGTTAHLVDFHPWLLSVWGSDVYDFPYKSPIHKWCVVSNLKAADAVASTSHCMAAQARRLVPDLREIPITPFGVDCDIFSPLAKQQESHNVDESDIVIGTVKSLSYTYGIDVLIKAFALCRFKLSIIDPRAAGRLRLRIVGEGPDLSSLKVLANQQQVSDAVFFVGAVPHTQVPDELRKFDIYSALSREESFGVAAIEASAVGLPVVVSNAGGLSEVVLEGKTGLVVPIDNQQAAADSLLYLILNPEIRQQLGRAGRAHVLANYSWDASIKKMMSIYENLIERHKSKPLMLK